MKIDVLVDLQFGDCGKGKISKYLLEQNNYEAICKYNGGPNAGHAVWIGDKKYTAHMLTSAIYDPDCVVVVGPGCVLNIDKFLKEIEQFSEFNLENRIIIHPHVHIIQGKHIEEDSKDSKIGTTKQGMGPCYADKSLRTGIRAEEVVKLKPYVRNWKPTESCLMEGSQGWWLDIDHGFYPYVTSSNIHPAHAFSTFGFPLQWLRRTYGVAKVYETYSGYSETMMKCDPQDEEKIRELGKEYGETTGRARKIGYLDLNRLIKAINSTGVQELFLNKIDILDELKIYKTYYHHYLGGFLHEFNTSDEFKNFIEKKLRQHCPYLEIIIFSGNKETL